jgi:hypothetical protein
MRRISVVHAMFLVGGLSVSTFAADAGQPADTIAWTDNSYSQLRAAFSTNLIAQSFIYDVLENSTVPERLDIKFNKPDVLDFNFIDLDGNGKLHLMSRIDYSGRGRSFYLLDISRVGGLFHVAVLDTHGAELGKISDIVKDLDHNGRKEITVRRPLASGAEGSEQLPFFDDIYVSSGGRFVQEDEYFRSYYRNVLLPSLEKTSATLIGNMQAEQNASLEMQISERNTLSATQKSIEALRMFLLND